MLLAISKASISQEVSVPAYSDGDKWVYSVTEESNVSGAMSSSSRKWETTVTRAGSKTIALASKPLDSNMPAKESLRDADWSSEKNINGVMTVTSHRYDFPMKPGKTWKVEYVTQNPDARTKSEKITKNYTVVGWVSVKVPAGTFRALKVEMEGAWTKTYNEIGPSSTATVAQGQAGSVAMANNLKARTPDPVSGKLYEAVWYTPEIKGHVKFIDENYQAGGALNKRITEELESSTIQ